jgi:hypothetical protein
MADSTKPKVPNVTLEVVGGPIALDDKGSTSQTFDYPEFLSPEELKAYEAWMATQGGIGGGGGGVNGGGKYFDDQSAATLEF